MFQGHELSTAILAKKFYQIECVCLDSRRRRRQETNYLSGVLELYSSLPPGQIKDQLRNYIVSVGGKVGSSFVLHLSGFPHVFQAVGRSGVCAVSERVMLFHESPEKDRPSHVTGRGFSGFSACTTWILYGYHFTVNLRGSSALNLPELLPTPPPIAN
ncbi:hypothetical protein AVEN_75368-1 [Araneus ventricosus]|uniref:Uncharacterized protein n=1 Tax=Araneus ventricosus TaxID=182803 RepID=A0A4Y2R3F2_ARAVE|nr:hypothetical protein AVEN_75368-1 [Araneus ventricosus]